MGIFELIHQVMALIANIPCQEGRIKRGKGLQLFVSEWDKRPRFLHLEMPEAEPIFFAVFYIIRTIRHVSKFECRQLCDGGQWIAKSVTCLNSNVMMNAGVFFLGMRVYQKRGKTS